MTLAKQGTHRVVPATAGTPTKAGMSATTETQTTAAVTLAKQGTHRVVPATAGTPTKAGMSATTETLTKQKPGTPATARTQATGGTPENAT